MALIFQDPPASLECRAETAAQDFRDFLAPPVHLGEMASLASLGQMEQPENQENSAFQEHLGPRAVKEMQGPPEHQGKLAWRGFQGPWAPEDSRDPQAHPGQALHRELMTWRAPGCLLFLLFLEHVDQKGCRVHPEIQG